MTVQGLVVAAWTCIGAKGPSAPSFLNNSCWGRALIDSAISNSRGLDLYLEEGAFGPFRFKTTPVGSDFPSPQYKSKPRLLDLRPSFNKKWLIKPLPQTTSNHFFLIMRGDPTGPFQKHNAQEIRCVKKL